METRRLAAVEAILRVANMGRWEGLLVRAANEARARMLEQRRFTFW